MELPLCLIYVDDQKIIDVNSTFDSMMKLLNNDYKHGDIINRNISDIFEFEEDYTLMTISTYRLYLRYTKINNIIALNCINNDIIDSKYFIHNTITPLTNIIELTKILDNTSLNAKQKEYISIIKRNNFELTKNISDITSFLTYFGKGVKLYYESMNLATEINNVLHLISNMYKTSIDLQINQDIVLHDRQIMFDILYHLVFIFIKNSNENHMQIHYKDKKIVFTSKAFDESYKQKIQECIIHTYNYNESLDFHIIKLLLKLTKTKIEYNDKSYILSLN